MSIRPGAHESEGLQYRRGALMGFTVAESFMLIAFALLLLLAVWRFSEAERGKALDQLTPIQLSTINQAAATGVLNDLLALKNRPVEDLKRMASGGAVVQPVRLTKLEETSRLVEEAEIRRLAEAAVKMPEDIRRQLVDLVRLEDYHDLLERFEALKALERTPGLTEAIKKLSDVDGKQLAKLAEGGLLGAWAKAMNKASEAGMSPDEVADAIAFAKQIAANRATVGGIESAVADRIRARTGQLVAKMGGEITPSGDVILPDALLFAAGEATLTREMGAFLDGFCRPWFEILNEAGSSLASIQIEGHASSEWHEFGPQDAYLRNLALSQARARTVFEYCLRSVGDDAIGTWAREKLAAVGYSSARRIMVDGKEDRSRSRRVVFNIDADRSSFFEKFDADKALGRLDPHDSSAARLGDKP